MTDIKIILPCAGEGSRLNLPYPKELFTLQGGKAFIDYTFDILYPIKDKIEIIVVLNEGKLEIINYLEKYNNDFEITYKIQKKNKTEFSGAIKTCRNNFGKYNFVFLPDTIVACKDGIFEKSINILDKQGLVFWVKNEESKEILIKEGAVSIDKSENGNLYINKIIEKPSIKQICQENLNGHWGALAFTNSCLELFFTIIDSPKGGVNAFKKGTFEAIPIDVASDLGTWQSIYNFMGAHSFEKGLNIFR